MTVRAELTFSQRERYRPIPTRLGLEELPRRARERIWDVVYKYTLGRMDDFENWDSRQEWESIFENLNIEHYELTLERSEELGISENIQRCKNTIHDAPFYEVLDLVERIMRHRSCPDGVCNDIARAFAQARVAYMVMQVGQPTIVPAVSEEEGEAITGAVQDMEVAGFTGTQSHLYKAVAYLKEGRWSDSVRESSHALEAVCKKLSPDSGNRLSASLNDLGRMAAIHPALLAAFTKLYGYASDEQGVRHSSGEGDKNVGLEEAAFMLSACAAACSYLWRKVQDPGPTEVHEQAAQGETRESVETTNEHDLDDVPF